MAPSGVRGHPIEAWPEMHQELMTVASQAMMHRRGFHLCHHYDPAGCFRNVICHLACDIQLLILMRKIRLRRHMCSLAVLFTIEARAIPPRTRDWQSTGAVYRGRSANPFRVLRARTMCSLQRYCRGERRLVFPIKNPGLARDLETY